LGPAKTHKGLVEQQAVAPIHCSSSNQQLPTTPETQNPNPNQNPKPKSLNPKKQRHPNSKQEEEEMNFGSSSSNLKLLTPQNNLKSCLKSRKKNQSCKE
jgi:hypothetical protein